MQGLKPSREIIAFLAVLALVALVEFGVSIWLIAAFSGVMILWLGFAFNSDQSNAIETGVSSNNKQGRLLLDEMARNFTTLFFIVDENERVSYISPPAQEAFQHLELEAHYNRLARAQIYVNSVRSALGGQAIAPFTFNINRLNERIFEAYIHPINGELAKLTKGKLLVEILDRTDELKSDMTRRDFIANASHELRTPLTAVLGGIETIEELGAKDQNVEKKILPMMKKQAERMSRLVEDLMSLSQIELKEHMPPDAALKISKALEDALQSLEPKFKKHSIKIENGFKPDFAIKGDADQLQQVFVNILDNAIRYGGKGKTITITRQDDHPVYPDKIGIMFADEGEGIAPEHIHRLTERFYRVSASESRDKGGTGLGLAIVKHILRRHQGELQITSRIGESSQFTIWLPPK